MSKEVIGDPITLPDGTRVPISQAVRGGGFLFIAGQLGVDESFRVVGDDIETQTARALENMKTQLEAGGSAPKHVVKVNAWITDQADFPGFNKVYATVFGRRNPRGDCSR